MITSFSSRPTTTTPTWTAMARWIRPTTMHSAISDISMRTSVTAMTPAVTASNLHRSPPTSTAPAAGAAISWTGCRWRAWMPCGAFCTAANESPTRQPIPCWNVRSCRPMHIPLPSSTPAPTWTSWPRSVPPAAWRSAIPRSKPPACRRMPVRHRCCAWRVATMPCGRRTSAGNVAGLRKNPPAMATTRRIPALTRAARIRAVPAMVSAKRITWCACRPAWPACSATRTASSTRTALTSRPACCRITATTGKSCSAWWPAVTARTNRAVCCARTPPTWPMRSTLTPTARSRAPTASSARSMHCAFTVTATTTAPISAQPARTTVPGDWAVSPMAVVPTGAIRRRKSFSNRCGISRVKVSVAHSIRVIRVT